MVKFMKTYKLKIVVILIYFSLTTLAYAQFDIEGDFRMRAYNDNFLNTRDNRESENYMRFLARIRAKLPVNSFTTFYTELITFTDNNPTSPVRNIAGTGKMYYGISKIFAEIVQPNFLFFDLLRVRVGRQQFRIGNGLSLGESYYYVDKFDGGRFDLSYNKFNLSLFGAITGQNVSESGLYPDPGSDQLYVAKLSRNTFNHDLMLYYIYQKPRGDFNDSYIVGTGVNADWLDGKFNYYLEGAYQKFNTINGIPKKSGIGYMGGISYRWRWGFLRSIKIETRYAAYQGDDASTEQIEQFSPSYPSFFWGDRIGYVNGEIGGYYPHDGRNLEGSRIWYSRIYIIPNGLPRFRLQIQYIKMLEYVNNDSYNTFNDELAFKVYYRLSNQTQLQFRYAIDFSNGEDKDLNNNGNISWSEDRVNRNRIMIELNVKY